MLRCRSLRRVIAVPLVSAGSRAGRAAARPCRRSAAPSPGGRRSGRPARTAATIRCVLGVGVGDVGLQHRDGQQHLVQRRLHRGDRLHEPARAATAWRCVRCRRESAWRCSAGRRGRDDRGVRRLELGARCVVGQRRAAASAAAPGSTTRRQLERVEPVARCAGEIRAAARADGVRGRRVDDGAAAATAGGLDQPGLAQRGHRLAQRRARDPEPLGQLALGRQRRAARVDAQPDRGGQLLDAGLEGVVAAHRAQHAPSGRVRRGPGLGGVATAGHGVILGTPRPGCQSAGSVNGLSSYQFHVRAVYRPPTAGLAFPTDTSRDTLEGVPHDRHESPRQLSRRRGACSPAGLQAGAEPNLVELLELRDLVLDHLDPRRLLHDLRAGAGTTAARSRSRGAGRSSRPSSSSSGSPCRELVSAYPTSGGIYWWAAKMGGPAAGLLHRLAQPHRPARRHRLGRLRRRDLPRPHDLARSAAAGPTATR